MIRIRLILLLIICSFTAHSQVTLELGCGLDLENLNELNTFQSLRMSNLPVNAKMVYAFPHTLAYQSKILVNSEFLRIGAFFRFNSTGSRISYGDYSGYFNFDVILSSYSLGPSTIINIANKKQFSLDICLNVPFNYIKLTLKDKLSVGDDVIMNDQAKFYSTTISIFPELNPSYHLNKFTVGLTIGYMLNVPGKYTILENDDAYLVNSNGSRVKSNISGFRTGIQLSFDLAKSN